MPEMIFRVRWPDGSATACYSPSLVIKEHLTVGESYPLAEFVRRSRDALAIASERVAARYGFPCSRAMAQSTAIVSQSQRYESDPNALVTVLSFEE